MAESLDDPQKNVGNSQTAEDVTTASEVGRLAVALASFLIYAAPSRRKTR